MQPPVTPLRSGRPRSLRRSVACLLRRSPGALVRHSPGPPLRHCPDFLLVRRSPAPLCMPALLWPSPVVPGPSAARPLAWSAARLVPWSATRLVHPSATALISYWSAARLLCSACQFCSGPPRPSQVPPPLGRLPAPPLAWCPGPPLVWSTHPPLP
ncbi:hypothetical protein VPH35_092915 [Triticum aestivum]